MVIEQFDMDTLLAPGDTRTDDVLAIHDLWRQIGDDNTDALHGDSEGLRVLMSGLDYLVSREQNLARVIGAISIMDCGRGLAKIDSLAVHPDYRHRGLGLALARGAIEHCVARGYAEITTTAMPSSQALFTRLGFETYEVHTTGNASMFFDIEST